MEPCEAEKRPIARGCLETHDAEREARNARARAQIVR